MKRLGFVDALRGYAALYVLAFHVAYSPVPNLPTPELIAPIVFFGFSGITLFFVVSAFSLCLTMPRHTATGAPFLSFAVSRFFRIAPLFYVLIIYSTLRDSGWLARPPDLLLAAISASFLFNLSPSHVGSVVWGGWTIGVEMLFYAIFPLIYFMTRGRLTFLTGVFLFFLGLFALFVLAAPEFVAEPYLARFKSRSIVRHLPSFMIGMLAYYVYLRALQSKRSSAIGVAAMLVAGALFYVQIYKRSFLAPLPEIGDALAYAALLLGLGLVNVSAVVNPVARYYGRISYSLYLWHIPVIWTVTPALRGLYASTAVPVAYLLSTMLVGAIATVVAHASYRLIERPGESAGRRLLDQLLKRRRGLHGATRLQHEP